MSGRFILQKLSVRGKGKNIGGKFLFMEDR